MKNPYQNTPFDHQTLKDTAHSIAKNKRKRSGLPYIRTVFFYLNSKLLFRKRKP